MNLDHIIAAVGGNVITIDNDGPAIKETNYFETDVAQKRSVNLSVNDGTIRLLIPEPISVALPDMISAKEVVVYKGMWDGKEALEVLFDDHTASPFCLMCLVNQAINLPIEEEIVKRKLVLLYTGAPLELRGTIPGYYREVARLAYMSR